MTPEQIEYELRHFRNTPWEENDVRQRWAIERWRLPEVIDGSVLEIGTGPYGGCLPFIKARAKVALDPLWKQYYAAGFSKPDGIIAMGMYVEEIEEPNPSADVILCFNVLEHGENPSFDPILKLSKMLHSGGRFYLCQSLRTVEQCNEAHVRPMLVEDLDRVISESGLRVVRQWIEPAQPMFDYPMVMGVYERWWTHSVGK